jgi:hypothetical protein
MRYTKTTEISQPRVSGQQHSTTPVKDHTKHSRQLLIGKVQAEHNDEALNKDCRFFSPGSIFLCLSLTLFPLFAKQISFDPKAMNIIQHRRSDQAEGQQQNKNKNKN